jgi:hypothetical protein
MKRMHRFIAQRQEQQAYQFDDVPDPRDRRGVCWSLGAQLRAVWMAMLVGAWTLRQVESLTEDLAIARRRNGRWDRLPDSTLGYVLGDIEWKALRDKLVLQVRDMERAKVLDPVGLPFGVLAVDGKTLGSYDNDLGGLAQKNTREDGTPYWLMRVLRAVLVTAPTHPCIDQQPIAAETNDMGAFGAFFAGLMASYGRGDLYEVISIDAGFASLQNATLVHEAQKAYWIGLKNNQPELHAEARRHLEPTVDPRTKTYPVAPEAETPWERHKGTRIRRQLWRTRDMAGYQGWTHLKQVVLVRQTTEDPTGFKAPVIEDRYFVTNLVPGRLDGTQLLTLVRMHWRIENNCFGTLDVQWLEDRRLCSRHGNAPLVLGLLRVMAYNVLGWLRGRHLRSEANRTMTWRELFDRVRMALAIALLAATEAVLQEPTPSA